jgi:hypothetical protein
MSGTDVLNALAVPWTKEMKAISRNVFQLILDILRVSRYVTVVVDTLYLFFFGWCLNFYHTVDEKCIYLKEKVIK